MIVADFRINIADILKDKPVGLKLYSNTFGYISFNGVHKDKVYFFSEDTNAHSVKPNGKMYDGGECIIFPSKEMRDWEKFSWKKGDVLVNSSGFKLLFDRWANDDYTRFFGKFNILEDSFSYETEKYTLVSKDETIDTFEIEKPEFKDGDVLFVKCNDSAFIEIFEYSKKNGDLCDHASLDITNQILNISGKYIIRKDEITELRLATEEEKKQFFSALANKGKNWDSEKKKVVNLKPKFDELKPFDKVVVRCSEADRWSIDFFSYKVHNGYICTGDAWFGYCLPYNEETSHLLGTTDEWKGGEG
jgi:hypothetical protein|nr:MAG TPA: hypothetical protein [Caudoviricetes sp.]